MFRYTWLNGVLANITVLRCFARLDLLGFMFWLGVRCEVRYPSLGMLG